MRIGFWTLLFLLSITAQAETTGGASSGGSLPRWRDASGSEGYGQWVDVYIGGQKDHQVFVITQPDPVSGQRILFLYPEPSGRKPKGQDLGEMTYIQSLTKFMKNWGKACPGVQHLPGVEIEKNKVELISGQQAKRLGFIRLLELYNPDVLVFQALHNNKPFNEEKWRKFLSLIPSRKKCMILGPQYSRHVAEDRSYTKALESLLYKTKHHCRLVSALSEMHEERLNNSHCNNFFERDGRLSECAEKLSAAESIRKICERDLRRGDL